jgi:hypothetical protein
MQQDEKPHDSIPSDTSSISGVVDPVLNFHLENDLELDTKDEIGMLVQDVLMEFVCDDE